jgi:hypothetical protein
MISFVGFFLALMVTYNFTGTSYLLDLKSGNLKYEYTKGEGRISSFKYNDTESKNLIMEIEKNGFDIFIKVMGGFNREFIFKDLPTAILDIEKLSVEHFYLLLDKKVQLSFKKMNYLKNNDFKSLSDLTLNCQGETSVFISKADLMKSCTKKMTINLKEYQSFEKNPLVKDFIFSIIEGKFQAESIIDLGISGKVKSSGLISYNESLDRIIIKVNDIKLGFFDVLDEVFDEVKKYESPQLKIQKPYIYILFTQEE